MQKSASSKRKRSKGPTAKKRSLGNAQPETKKVRKIRKVRAHKPRVIGRNGLKKDPIPAFNTVHTITAVDPGWRNMGVCKLDADTGRILEWHLIDVAAYMGREKSRNGRADFCGNDQLVEQIHKMMGDKRYESLFNSCLLAVEEQHEQFNRPGTGLARKQQTDFFKKLQVCMMMYYKCTGRQACSVNPRSVGSWFRTPAQKKRRDQSPQSAWYNLNKKESVENVQDWLESQDMVDEANLMFDELDRRKKEKCCAKQDDMTDAYRIGRYVLERNLPSVTDRQALKAGFTTYLDATGRVVIDVSNMAKESEF